VFNTQFEKIQPALLQLKVNNLKGFEESFSSDHLPETISEETIKDQRDPAETLRPEPVIAFAVKSTEPFAPELIGLDDTAVRK